MARCCGGSSCACAIVAGAHITITGTGAANNPFEIVGDVDLQVVSNTQFALTLNGTGTEVDPWSLEVAYAPGALLSGHPHVSDTAPTNGQVLKYVSGTGLWTPGAPTTAASGSVDHDTSLTGDGSVGDVLAVAHDPDRLTNTTADGIGLSDDGMNSVVRHFTNSTTRAAADPVPVLNSLSMLDSAPGRTDYWTGTQWLKVNNGVTYDTVGQLLALSGNYDGLGPLFVVIRQVVATTDGDGVFDMLTPDDLDSRAGVLSLAFQEVGPVGFSAVAFANIDRVSGTAYRLDTGEAYSGQEVAGVVTAYCY